VLVAILAGWLGCGSPEAGRARGEGVGADMGNRGAQLEIHGAQAPFHRTPLKAAGR
jgi:hypothetical protein